MPYPDVEAGLVGLLADLGYTCTSTPIDLQDRLPVLRIQRVGGGDDRFSASDFPNVLIQVFTAKDSANPRSAHDLTATLRDRMNGLQGVAIPGGIIDFSETVTGPLDVTYPDQTVSIVQTTYRLTTRAAA